MFKELFTEGKTIMADVIKLLGDEDIKIMNPKGTKIKGSAAMTFKVSSMDVKDMREVLGKSNITNGTRYFAKTTKLDDDTYSVELRVEKE